MRLFTAIEIDDVARSTIAAEQTRIASTLAKDASALRFVRAENLHLTLVFIGEVTEEQAMTLTTVMGSSLPQPPFRAVFGGLGVFPVRGAPRTLWLGLTEGAFETIELHQRVAERLGMVKDGTRAARFHPHLTLARWRRPRPSAHRVLAAGFQPRGVTVHVEAVTLFESHLSVSGPTYTSVAQARLQCP